MKAGIHDLWSKRTIPAILLLLLVQRAIAWVQGVNRHLATRSFSPRHQRRPIVSHRKSDTILHAQDDDSLDLYKTVAEQDPEWYREFVVNVLGEDLLESENAAPNGPPPPSSEGKLVRKYGSFIQPSTKASETIQLSPPQAVDVESAEVPLEVVSVGNSSSVERRNKTLGAENQTVDEVNGANTTTGRIFQLPNLLDALSGSETKVILDASTKETQAEAGVPLSKATSSDSKEPNKTDTTLVTTEDKESVSASLNSEVREGAEVHPTEATSTPSSKGSQGATNLSDLPETAKDGYSVTSGEIPAAESPVPDSTDDGRDGKNFPTKSKKATERKSTAGPITRASRNGRGEKTKDAPPRAGKDPSKSPQPDIVIASQDNKQTADASDKKETTKAQSWFDLSKWNTTSSITTKMSKEEELDRELSPRKSSDTRSVNMGIRSDESRYVVLYRDLYTGDLRAENLTSITNLGYNIGEIPYLQPDALALIVEEEIHKPSRGIPQQWQISQSQYEVLSDDIRVVPQEEAEELLQAATEKKRTGAKEAKYSSSHNKPDLRDNGGNEVGRESVSVEKKPQLVEKRRPRRADRQPASPATRESRRRRRLDKKPVSTDRPSRPRRERKRIYNAREVPKKPARVEDDDPPPPDSPLWVDMDTFRDLLRSEAELRVRILGEDWADVVKDESSWRLSLYKEWLWALNKGIGNPLFPSRSDLARGRPLRGGDAPDRRRNDKAPQRRPRADVNKDSTRRRVRPDRSSVDERDIPQRPSRTSRLENEIFGKTAEKTTDRQRQDTDEASNQMPHRRRRIHPDDHKDVPRRAKQTEQGPRSASERVTSRGSRSIPEDDSVASPGKRAKSQLDNRSSKSRTITEDEAGASRGRSRTRDDGVSVFRPARRRRELPRNRGHEEF